MYIIQKTVNGFKYYAHFIQRARMIFSHWEGLVDNATSFRHRSDAFDASRQIPAHQSSETEIIEL